MKVLLCVAVLLAAASVVLAITPEEIVRLVQLKTSDEVLLQLITTNPLEKPLTAAQTIYLKQNGVNERILSALLSPGTIRKDELPKQEGESYWLNESARYYYSVGSEGEKRLVVTNLDEKGNRMGPPPPPKRQDREPDPYPEQPVYQAPAVAMQQPIDYRQPSMTSPYSNVSYDYPSYSSPASLYYSSGFLWPQFTIIQPGFGHKPFPHCSAPPPPSRHRTSRSFR